MSEATLSSQRPKTANRHVADSFSRSVLLISCLMVVQRGIGFLRSFYVCGTLSPADVGQWDLAFNFLMLAAPLAVLGIPGSFGRYLARYEKDGQQSRFLNQTVSACLALSLGVAVLVAVFRESVARFFFGNSADTELVTLLAIGLPAVVFFNFATSWFSGRRLNRFVFRIQFVQTLFFALLCVVLFQLFSATAYSVTTAYLLSCFIGMLLAASYTFLAGRDDQDAEPTTPTDPIWRNILPFAVWVWISNALANLFVVCDRLLLVNFHSAADLDVQALVGQYHTACIFPLLLMTIGEMAANTGMPYLSKDWESGDHKAVTDRMNLMMKAIGLFCAVASVGILLVAPILFGQIWKDKFAMGEGLLPMTLCYCSLAAMATVAQKYFWCLEKTWIISVFLLIGLACNFILGIVLVGPYGIDGVVASTLISHAIVLAGILFISKRNQLQIDTGVFVIAAGLMTICLGKWIALLSLLVFLLASIYTEILFGADVKRQAFLRIKSIRSSLGQNRS